MYIINKSNALNIFHNNKLSIPPNIDWFSITKKHMSKSDLVLELDEKSDRERQRQLYDHNL